MKTLITAALFALALTGCDAEQNSLSTEGTLPVSPDPSVVYVGEKCVDDSDCDYRKLCVIDLRATESAGYTVMGCQAACDVEFETITVKNTDGTSEIKTVKVEGSDTCQRYGDEGFYCDPEEYLCKEYTEEPTEPTDPEPTPAQFVKVSCCFNAAVLTANTYAQLAWSTSDASNPEAFGKDGDLSLDANGCFTSTSKVERSKVFRGFWVELTLGLVQSLDDDGNVVYGQWLGTGENDEFAPISCEVDDEPVTIGVHMDQCGFGIDDATNLSCME